MAHIPWVALAALAAIGLAGAACSGKVESGSAAYCPGEVPSATATECRTHADCGAGSECVLPEASGSTEMRLIAPPGAPVAPPCSLTACSDDIECPTGEICDDPLRASTWSGDCYELRYCVPECNCFEGERCRADGHCEIIPCDAPDGPTCPTGTVCLPGVGDPGAPDATAEAAGCVRVRCDLPGGVVCEPGFICDPANAPDLGPAPPWGNTAGCAPISCEDGWTCAGVRVCYPDGTDGISTPVSGEFAMRPDGRTVDVHGCVAPNCEEGLVCQPLQTCDIGHPEATAYGCRTLRCDEPGGPDCETIYSGGRTCNPAGTNPDIYGCVDRPCLASPGGCTLDGGTATGGAPGTGGVSSTGGIAGTAGTGAGGSSTGGGGTPTGGIGAASGSAGEPSTGGRPDGAPEGAACSVDTDCGCGSCVLSVCAPRPGTCVPR